MTITIRDRTTKMKILKGFCRARLSLFEAEVPDIGNHQERENIDHPKDNDILDPACLDQSEVEKNDQGDHRGCSRNGKALEILCVSYGGENIKPS